MSMSFTDFLAYGLGINGKVKLGWGDFKEVGIARDSNNAHLLVGASAETTYTPELYYLEVDGKRLDGVYLGAENKTTVCATERRLLGHLLTWYLVGLCIP